MPRRRGQRRIGPQDPLVQLSQERARVDTELVGQPLADVRVHAERLGLPAVPVEDEHQQSAESFAERVLGH